MISCDFSVMNIFRIRKYPLLMLLIGIVNWGCDKMDLVSMCQKYSMIQFAPKNTNQFVVVMD